MKTKEVWLTVIEEEGVIPVRFHADQSAAMKEAMIQAEAKIGRLVRVFKRVDTFSAEVVVKRNRLEIVMPRIKKVVLFNPKKTRSDKGTKKAFKEVWVRLLTG